MTTYAIRRWTAMTLLALCLALIPAAQRVMTSAVSGSSIEILDGGGGGWGGGGCC
jgi:hypothetical protein